MSGRELRCRKVAHAWWDKNVTRFIRENSKGKERVNLRHVYLALCEIDSDFAGRAKTEKICIRNITKTCATYAGMDKSTVSKYMQKLRNSGLIDYGQERKDNGTFGKTYLHLFRFEGNSSLFSISELENHRGKKTPKSVNSYQYKNNTKVLDDYKNESKDSRTVFKENSCTSQKRCVSNKAFLSDQKSSVANKETVATEYTFRKKTPPQVLLSEWLDHYISDDQYEKPILRFRTRLLNHGIEPDASATIDIVNYWNKLARSFQKQGFKITAHALKATKTMHLCQVIVAGLTNFKGFTLEDIRFAIDNYAEVLEISPWHRRNQYSFPRFFSNQKLFYECLEGDIDFDEIFSKVKPDRQEVFEKMCRDFKRKHFREPDEYEQTQLWCETELHAEV